MAQYVLNAKARVITRRTICKLSNDEIFCETKKKKLRLFEDLIQKRLGDSMAQPEKPVPTEYEPYSDGIEPAFVQIPEDNDLVKADGTTDYDKPITDHWLHAGINLLQAEKIQNAKVIGRDTNKDGNVIGTYQVNPYYNTMVYDVEFPDG